ncbi:PREDICTED: probable GTP diphosphokinase CRSH, chloroplastic [Tarenaya hassleriana]|uniref:probable GTP diphosphokinase CRSH, chloroplastic n=1 Tax=Tarenaya hassleriana TaxID=28532 RepID=UPI00053C9284|nr:PREDICTED: probable GTP diphosphokinase CRSH, chloroplastic [Tarenaya hassleriana]
MIHVFQFHIDSYRKKVAFRHIPGNSRKQWEGETRTRGPESGHEFHRGSARVEGSERTEIRNRQTLANWEAFARSNQPNELPETLNPSRREEIVEQRRKEENGAWRGTEKYVDETKSRRGLSTAARNEDYVEGIEVQEYIPSFLQPSVACQMEVLRPLRIPVPKCGSPRGKMVVQLRPILHANHLVQHRRRRRRRLLRSEATGGRSPEAAGGKMVVQLVGAFNEVTERMNSVWLSTCSSRLLFKALKLSIPILQSLPPAPDGRSPLSKALSLALLLADLQMDGEVISASILSEIVEAGAISIYEVRDRISTGTAHLLHEIVRMKSIPFKIDVLDDETAAALRKFYLTYYDVRAVIMDLILKLDKMRHLDHLPRYSQQMLSLEVMKIYAPLAHTVGANRLSLELEDLSFSHLFPYSYLYLDSWLRNHESGSTPLIDVYKEHLHQALKADPALATMTDDVIVKGRYKSRYSMMKKLLRDGRKPEEVNDVLGLRVILMPSSAADTANTGEEACYRTRQIIQSLWKEIPERTKDYIAHPKANGYRSLHMAVDVSERGRVRPLMEIQIRTTDMDALANAGTASHSLYKGGLTDPEEAKRIKAIMMAATELAEIRMKDLSYGKSQGWKGKQREGEGVFSLLDKNGDGRISIEELIEVMEELGAPGEDAEEMMQLLDLNNDGSLSCDEFDNFQKQVEFTRKLEEKDREYRSMLDEKLHQVSSSSSPLV